MNDVEQLYAVYAEAKSTHESSALQEFAQKREAGARKIADGARAKGGAATLTYHHFQVKLPHYKKAIAGNFDAPAAKKQLKQLIEQLNAAVNGKVEMQQIEFQKNMGLIEVLGELLIFSQ